MNKLKTTSESILEQYKIMVSSTEKVIEQRQKTNSLFFTITSTLLSISFVLGKEFQFDFFAILIMFALTSMAFICTFFWKQLITSYGCLNSGKFKVIEELEAQLNTNLFQREWEILVSDLKYRSSTKTETNIIMSYRILILAIIVVEVIFAIIKYGN